VSTAADVVEYVNGHDHVLVGLLASSWPRLMQEFDTIVDLAEGHVERCFTRPPRPAILFDNGSWVYAFITGKPERFVGVDLHRGFSSGMVDPPTLRAMERACTLIR